MTAYQCSSGDVVFAELARYDIVRTLTLPCGQCHGCRLERSRQWAMRCVHEASMHKRNCFITLTYEEEHLPERNRLHHKDFQDFMKRLRKQIAPNRVRFYMAGEYGDLNGRPHYHACLFGHDWDDKQYFKTSPSKEKIYTSPTLEKLWPWGFTSTANVTFESAAYIARYCLKKVTGDLAEEHYKRYDHLGEYQLVPEYNEMSLKPGIGATWLKKWEGDVYNFDHVIINGKECKPPKYYDKLFNATDPERFEELKFERVKQAMTHWMDNTDERLRVKEQVSIAKIKNLQRGKI